MLIEAVEDGAHAVDPHLGDTAVEARQDPWMARVEGLVLDPVALGFDLGEHLPPPSEGSLCSLSQRRPSGLGERWIGARGRCHLLAPKRFDWRSTGGLLGTGAGVGNLP